MYKRQTAYCTVSLVIKKRQCTFHERIGVNSYLGSYSSARAPTFQYLKARLLLSPHFSEMLVCYTHWRVSTISVLQSPASICHCQTHQSQCSQSPPTLKCRRIHSLSLFFFSHKIVTRGPLKSRNCTRKRLAAGLRSDQTRWVSLSAPLDPLAAIWGLSLIHI